MSENYELIYDESTNRYTITLAQSEPLPEGKAYCRKCSNIVDENLMRTISTEYGKITMCTECYLNNYEVCLICGKTHKKSQMLSFTLHDGETVRCCDRCRESFIECTSCGSLHRQDTNSLTPIDGYEYCNTCFQAEIDAGDILKCEDCGEYTKRSASRTYDNKIVCRRCAKDYVPIHEYSYKPTPKFKGRGKSFYGFELEVQVPEDMSSEDIATKVRDGFLYCKRDGSIGHGFEIVSHPFTEDWFYKNKEVFDKIFALRSIGCDGFHNNKCGMHVHITKEFSHLEIFKMMKIMYSTDNYEFWKKISRRKQNEFETWCSTEKSDYTIKNESKTKGISDNRRTALNMTQKTIECRIFRSTLDKRMFFGNLEMMFVLTNFVKSGKSLRASNLNDFQKFIYDSKYEDAKYLVKKVTSRKTILGED